MARTVVTTDDIDGSANAETIKFSFDGAAYTIDLSKKNRTAFEKALKPYVAAAQKVPAGRRRTPPSSASRRRAGTRRKSVDLAAVREWARENGIEVAERGRVAEDTIVAYTEATR